VSRDLLPCVLIWRDFYTSRRERSQCRLELCFRCFERLYTSLLWNTRHPHKRECTLLTDLYSHAGQASSRYLKTDFALPLALGGPGDHELVRQICEVLSYLTQRTPLDHDEGFTSEYHKVAESSPHHTTHVRGLAAARMHISQPLFQSAFFPAQLCHLLPNRHSALRAVMFVRVMCMHSMEHTHLVLHLRQRPLKPGRGTLQSGFVLAQEFSCQQTWCVRYAINDRKMYGLPTVSRLLGLPLRGHGCVSLGLGFLHASKLSRCMVSLQAASRTLCCAPLTRS